MKRWKILTSVALSTVIFLQSAIPVYTPEPEPVQGVTAEKTEKKTKEETRNVTPEESYEETDIACDGQEILQVSAGTEYDPDNGIVTLSDSVVFTDEQGNAIFNEQTEAALDEFTDELRSILEEYPPEQPEELTVTSRMAQENLSGQQLEEQMADGNLSEEIVLSGEACSVDDSTNLYASAAQEGYLAAATEENEFLTRRLIVKASDDFDTYGAVAVADGYRDYFVLQYETSEETMNAYEQLEEDADIEFVQTDSVIEVEETTASGESVSGEAASLELQSGMPGSYITASMTGKTRFTSWGGRTIGADAFNTTLLEVNSVLPIVVVGVLDTGIDYSHPIFENRVIHNDVNYSGDGYAADDVYSYHPHGTATAGIVADLTMENVLVKPYKVLGYEGTGYDSGICAGWLAAIEDDVDVINMSLGEEQVSSPMEEEMAELSVQRDIPVVVAAGNDAADTSEYSPAGIESCITVSATTNTDEIAFYSNTGKEVDLAAPGSDIKVPQNDGTYEVGSGTSYAAPHVTAAVAMLRSWNNNMSREDIISNLMI